MTKLQKIRQRFEAAGGERERVARDWPKLTGKRKVAEAVMDREEARKAPRLVAGEEETVERERGGPVERKKSGQRNISNNPHLFMCRELGAGGQRGEGLRRAGRVVGGSQGSQVGQRVDLDAAFSPSQRQHGGDQKSEKQKAVIGPAAASMPPRANGGPASSQLRITDLFGGKRTPPK